MRALLKTMTVMLLAAAAAAPAAAETVTYTFNTTGSTSDNGTYGNALSFSSTSDPTLQMRVTGWQSNQSTNDITKAYLGAYSGGLGVTGLGDQSGSNGFHQIDNVGGYTDFLLLQFSRAVTLSGVDLNTYNMAGLSGRDSDLAFFDAGGVTSANWNSAVDLTAYDTVPTLWTTVEGGANGGSRAIGAAAASTKWLVGTAFRPTNDKDDGFKLASLTVTQAVSPVPEPATWAMMLIGFGGAGAALRRNARSARRRTVATA